MNYSDSHFSGKPINSSARPDHDHKPVLLTAPRNQKLLDVATVTSLTL